MVGKFGCNSGNKGNSSVTAYQIAVENGFQGTVQEWLQSLKGERGEAGIQGPPGPHGEAGPAGMGAAGADGLNGSQIYLVDDVSQLNNIGSPIVGRSAPHDYAIVKSTMDLYIRYNNRYNAPFELVGSLGNLSEPAVLKTSTNITTSQQISGFSQNGKTIVSQGTNNIVITIDSEDGFTVQNHREIVHMANLKLSLL